MRSFSEFGLKTDVVIGDKITNIMVVDTLAILKDYTAIKHYSYTLFDNEHGTLKLSQKTQYNSLIYTDYSYICETKVPCQTSFSAAL